MIRIAIVDDENIICSEIDNYILKAIKNKIEKADISVYYSGEKFLYALQNGESFDLIFMDIEMKEISGIDVRHKKYRTVRFNFRQHGIFVVI